MLIDFFFTLKSYQVPVSTKELLDLLAALKQGVVFADIEQFYGLARACLVKDEKYYDRYDQAFTAYFEGDSNGPGLLHREIPSEWLQQQLQQSLSQEQRDKIEALGDLDALMKTFQKRLKEQKKRHQGGSKWIGTGGTSPFGAFGYNPAGIRVGGESTHRRAVKVWQQRHYANLDDSKTLDIRNFQVALKRLRKMARQGTPDQLDLPGTIQSTAAQGGLLDVKMEAERRNRVKVLLFFDVGGSMDPFVDLCETLFSAAKTEFKYLEFFYFHNCIYERVWRNNLRRQTESTPTWDLLHKYGSDYRVIIIGDAAMAPYEISHPGGSVEHMNQESGRQWLHRLTQHFDHAVWLNPLPEAQWAYTLSTQWIQEIFQQQMFPLTLAGLEAAMRTLSR